MKQKRRENEEKLRQEYEANLQSMESQSMVKIKQIEARIDAAQEEMNKISEDHAEKKDKFQDRLRRIREESVAEKKQEDLKEKEQVSQVEKGGKQLRKEDKEDMKDIILDQVRQSPNAARINPAQMNMLLNMLAEILGPPPSSPLPSAIPSGSSPTNVKEAPLQKAKTKPGAALTATLCPFDALLQDTSGRPDVIPAQMIGQPPPLSAAISAETLQQRQQMLYEQDVMAHANAYMKHEKETLRQTEREAEASLFGGAPDDGKTMKAKEREEEKAAAAAKAATKPSKEVDKGGKGTGIAKNIDKNEAKRERRRSSGS